MAPPKIGKMILLETGYQLKVFVKRQQPHSTSHFDTHSAPYDHQRPRDLMVTPTSEGQIAFSHHKTTYDLQTNTLTFTNVCVCLCIIIYTCIHVSEKGSSQIILQLAKNILYLSCYQLLRASEKGVVEECCPSCMSKIVKLPFLRSSNWKMT